MSDQIDRLRRWAELETEERSQWLRAAADDLDRLRGLVSDLETSQCDEVLRLRAELAARDDKLTLAAREIERLDRLRVEDTDDRERLDWIERTGLGVEHWPGNGDPWVVLIPQTRRVIYGGATPRAAIDAAIAAGRVLGDDEDTASGEE